MGRPGNRASVQVWCVAYAVTVCVCVCFSQMFESIPQLMASITAKHKIPVIKQV